MCFMGGYMGMIVQSHSCIPGICLATSGDSMIMRSQRDFQSGSEQNCLPGYHMLTGIYLAIARYTKWIGKHATTIIALSSMVIAGCSLVLTFLSHRDDLDYKEAYIRPILGLSADVDTFRFVMKNEGLGPAIIQRFAFALDGKCYDSETTNSEEYTAAAIKFEDKIGNDLYIKTLAEVTKKNKQLDISVTENPLKISARLRCRHVLHGLLIASAPKFHSLDSKPEA
jgi:hypothetical protein